MREKLAIFRATRPSLWDTIRSQFRTSQKNLRNAFASDLLVTAGYDQSSHSTSHGGQPAQDDDFITDLDEDDNGYSEWRDPERNGPVIFARRHELTTRRTTSSIMGYDAQAE